MRPIFLNPLLACLLFGGAASAQIATDVPLVLAIDSSRSLNAGDLSQATALLDALLDRLPADTPAGLLAFADQPRWLRMLGTPLREVRAALVEVQPEGRYTLLHDALFVAARDLDSGGVILLLTDGRDENSATTVGDVAQRCDDTGVRILAVGVGRNIEERSLRRLALLTGGEYVGTLDRVDASRLASALAAAEAGVREERLTASASADRGDAALPTAAPPPAEPAASHEAGVGSPSPSGQPASIPWGWIGLLMLLVAGGISTWILVRRRPQRRYCARCGTELAPGTAECPSCEAEDLQRLLRGREVAGPSETAEITIDPQLPPVDPTEALEKTRVLAHRPILLVREPGEAVRSLVLRDARAFGVGRDALTNTIAIPDPALSACHFKIVPENGAFFVVDLDSTNGTFLNRRRVRAQELHSGDVIQAGQVEFEFRSYDELTG